MCCFLYRLFYLFVGDRIGPIGNGVFGIGFGMGIPYECDMSFLMFLIPHRILFCDDQVGAHELLLESWKR